MRKIRVTADNHESAGKAVIDYLAGRPEVDAGRIGMGGGQIEMFMADWIVERLKDGCDPTLNRRQYVRAGGQGPFDSPIPDDYPWRW
jgi:hypothetical protein